MHSTLIRAQNVFGFFTTIIFIVSGLIASSVLLFPQSPSATLSLRNVQVVRGRAHYYSSQKSEYAHVKFDLDADLSSLFNWNTKQVFVYVLARWGPPPSASASSDNNHTHNNNNTINEAVVWDIILPGKPTTTKAVNAKTKTSQKPGVLSLRNQKPKYQITDPSGSLADRERVRLEVRYNVQPWVGALVWGGGGGGGEEGVDAGGRGGTRRKGWGRWEALRGGSSSLFRFPAVKGKGGTAGAGGAGGKKG